MRMHEIANDNFTAIERAEIAVRDTEEATTTPVTPTAILVPTPRSTGSKTRGRLAALK